ncbi:MAG: 6-phosphogluconolactonase [Sphingomonadaceae bacterium]
MSEVEWWDFDDAGELAAQAAGDIGFVISSAIEAHGGARIALSGSRGPEALFDALLAADIDWSRVTLLPTDEPLGSGEEKPHRHFEALFGARGARVLTLVEDDGLADYREIGRRADERLGAIPWPLDLVIFGMGDEGEVAGLVPGPDYERVIAGPNERRAAGVEGEDGADRRVTLTAAALRSARTAMILISGAEKKALLERAIEQGPLSRYPVGRLIAEMDIPIDIFWKRES